MLLDRIRKCIKSPDIIEQESYNKINIEFISTNGKFPVCVFGIAVFEDGTFYVNCSSTIPNPVCMDYLEAYSRALRIIKHFKLVLI